MANATTQGQAGTFGLELDAHITSMDQGMTFYKAYLPGGAKEAHIWS